MDSNATVNGDVLPPISPQGLPYSEIPHFINDDGEHIFTKTWQPAKKPRALVYICHGGGEHCLRYSELASSLVKDGYLVFSNDHVGHGQSQGERFHVETISVYIRDTTQYIKQTITKYPDVDVFMIAISMGGAIALRVALESKELFRGMILIAPALVAHCDFAPAWKVKVVEVLAKVMPKAEGAKIDPSLLSRDKEKVKAYEDDPLNWHGGLRAKWSIEMIENKNYLEANLRKLDVPFYVLHGERDLICDVASSKLVAEKSVSSDKNIKIYTGFYHSLLDEPPEDRNKVITDILEWMNERN